MYKIIIDTNIINPTAQLDVCIGKPSLLQELKNCNCEIILPDMVIGEIKNHKLKTINEQIYALNKNQALKFLANSSHSNEILDYIQNFNVVEHINQLLETELREFNITVIQLSNTQVLYDMKDRVLANLAPFENTGDKGFKDSYIYYTVLEYFEDITNHEKVFFMTNDKKLKLSFENHYNIKVIKTIDEFKNSIVDKYKKPYFIQLIKYYFQSNIEILELLAVMTGLKSSQVIPDDIENMNIEFQMLDTNYLNQDILTICINKQEYCLIFDENEIYKITTRKYKKLLEDFINSNSFRETNSLATIFNDGLINFLSKQDITNILTAYKKNSQIIGTFEYYNSYKNTKNFQTTLLNILNDK